MASESRSSLIGHLKSYVSKRLLSTRESDEEGVTAFLDQLVGASDRIVVLIVSGLLEDALRLCIEESLSNSKPRLYTSGGLLHTFDAKIQIGHALGIVSDEARGDLDLIRELRNAAAHGMVRFSFKDDPVEKVCMCLLAQDSLKIVFTRKTTAGVRTPGGRRLVRSALYYFMALVADDAKRPITPTSYTLR